MSFLRYKDIALVPSKHAYEYACMDADATFRAHKRLQEILQQDGLSSYLEYPMIPLSRDLLLSGLRGIKVHKKKTHQLASSLDDIMIELEGRVFEIARDDNLNIRSPVQKARLLFDVLEIPPVFVDSQTGQEVPVPTTLTGQYQTSKDILLALYETHRHEVLQYLIDHSACAKMLSTYVHPGLTKWMDPVDRVHTTFKVGGAKTGRITSGEPPIATIPRDREFHFFGELQKISLRDLFIADPDWEITYGDVSQAELCVLAICSGEDRMLEAFKNGVDYHTQTARDCLGVGIDQVPDKNTRVVAKCINFGMVYGGSPQGIAAQARADVALVEDAMSRFFEVNSNVQRFLDAVAFLAISEGRLKTPFGRIRRFMGVHNADRRVQGKIEREAKNMFCQNGAAEVVFRALTRICRQFEKYHMKAWPVNIVYDNIITEHPKKERRDVKDIMIEEMTRPVPELDDFRFTVDLGQAESWGDAERNAETIRVS